MKYSKALLSRRQEFKISRRSLDILNKAGVVLITICTSDGYARVKVAGRKDKLLLHRFLMELMGYDLSGLQVDHKNRRRLDNRMHNLRVATISQNRGNASISKRNTSGYKGVHLHKKSGRWRAAICSKPGIHLGYFNTPEEAARAYNAAAKKRWGKFANLNCIPRGVR